MKRRREEATTMVSLVIVVVVVVGGDDSGGDDRTTGNSGTTTGVRKGREDVRPDRGTISVPRLPTRRRRPVYLEGDDFRVAERPAAERRHRPL